MKLKPADDIDLAVRSLALLQGFREVRNDAGGLVHLARGAKGFEDIVGRGWARPAVGRCPGCKRPVRSEAPAQLSFRALNGPGGACLACERFVALKFIKGTVNPHEKCGGRCRSSTGPQCSCSCGGKNHGKG
jgi:hypothetical protein